MLLIFNSSRLTLLLLDWEVHHKISLSKCVLSLWGHCRERPFGAWREESCLEQKQNSHFRCSWTQGRSCIGCKPPPWVRTSQRNALGPIEGADFVRGVFVLSAICCSCGWAGEFPSWVDLSMDQHPKSSGGLVVIWDTLPFNYQPLFPQKVKKKKEKASKMKPG